MPAIEAFVEAVKKQDLDTVNALLKEAEVREQINAPLLYFDAPALVFAAGSGNIPLAAALLGAGADINLKSSWWAGGFAPIHNANAEMTEFLIEHGATIDVYAASKLGLTERLIELLDANPELAKEKGPDGMTALHFAATPQIADLLLKRGADIEARDIDHGATAAQYAAGVRPEVCRFLVGRGADTDVFMAAAQGDKAELELILRAFSDLLNTTTTTGPHNPVPAPGEHIYVYQLAYGASPLAVAALKHQFEAAELLLGHGIEISKIVGKATALHHAAWRGNREAVEFLLAHGADRMIQDLEFRSTPAGWARHAGHTELATLLD